MHARVNTIEGSPDRMDDVTTHNIQEQSPGRQGEEGLGRSRHPPPTRGGEKAGV
jgi:hypothetical protein